MSKVMTKEEQEAVHRAWMAKRIELTPERTADLVQRIEALRGLALREAWRLMLRMKEEDRAELERLMKAVDGVMQEEA
jgi:recombinational DNA repair protein RecR